MATKKVLGRLGALGVVSGLALGGAVVGGASPADAVAWEPGDRIRTEISSGGVAWNVVVAGADQDRSLQSIRLDRSAIGSAASFVVPAPGQTGAFEVTSEPDGLTACIRESPQRSPFLSAELGAAYARGGVSPEPCQTFETVVDRANGLTGFKLVGGEWDGRYLGDESRGGAVDFAQQTMFAVDLLALSAPVEITGPSGEVRTAKPTIAGDGAAGAKIVVTDAGGVVIGETTVGADGTWSLTPKTGLPLGAVGITATQTDDANQRVTTAQGSFTVVDATPKLDARFAPASAPVGETTNLVYTITNTPDLAEKAGWKFSDALPAGLTIAGEPSTTCASATLSAVSGATAIDASGALADRAESCTVTVPVRSASTAPASYTLPATKALTGLHAPTEAKVSFTIGPVLLENSSIQASPATLTADGSATSTVTVRLADEFGNALVEGGRTVTMSTTGGTLSTVTDNGDGTYRATLTAPKTAGSGTISFTVDGAAAEATATVEFTVGAADAIESTISVGPDQIPADGTSTSAVTVTLSDAHGNPHVAGGSDVVLMTTSGTLSNVKDNGNGSYGAILTSSTDPGAATLSFSVNGVMSPQVAVVVFAAVDQLMIPATHSPKPAKETGLAVTGAIAPVAGIAGAALALVSGGVLVAARSLRRRKAESL